MLHSYKEKTYLQLMINLYQTVQSKRGKMPSLMVCPSLSEINYSGRALYGGGSSGGLGVSFNKPSFQNIFKLTGFNLHKIDKKNLKYVACIRIYMYLNTD